MENPWALSTDGPSKHVSCLSDDGTITIFEFVFELTECKGLDALERCDFGEQGWVAIDFLEVVCRAVAELLVGIDELSCRFLGGWGLGLKRFVPDSLNESRQCSVALVESMALSKCAHDESLVVLGSDRGLKIANIVVLKMRPAVTLQDDHIPPVEHRRLLQVVHPDGSGVKTILRPFIRVRDDVVVTLSLEITRVLVIILQKQDKSHKTLPTDEVRRTVVGSNPHSTGIRAQDLVDDLDVVHPLLCYLRCVNS